MHRVFSFAPSIQEVPKAPELPIQGSVQGLEIPRRAHTDKT